MKVTSAVLVTVSSSVIGPTLWDSLSDDEKVRFVLRYPFHAWLNIYLCQHGNVITLAYFDKFPLSTLRYDDFVHYLDGERKTDEVV